VAAPEDEQVYRCTRDVRLVEVNDAMSRMYGCATPDELIGSQLSSTFDLDDPRSVEFFRAFVRSGYRTVELESFEFDRTAPRTGSSTTCSAWSRTACSPPSGAPSGT
jgi:hypothetical protein